MIWNDNYKGKLVSAEEAVKVVKSGDRVGMPSFSPPRDLGLSLAARRNELRNVTLVSNWTQWFPWFQPGWEESFRVLVPFVLRQTREGVHERRLDFVPYLFGLENGWRQAGGTRKGNYPYTDVFMLKVTPPNKNGYCSFGHFPLYSPVAARTAKTVIAEVDPFMPWTFGECIHISQIDFLVEPQPKKKKEKPPLPIPPEEEAGIASVIGSHVADLIRDGDTLQVGSGTASEACMEFLSTKNDLRVYSEVIFPQMIDLMKAGVIKGSNQHFLPEQKVICTGMVVYEADPKFREWLDYLDCNPAFDFRDVSRVCNVPDIAANDNMVTVNNALSIDLLGQIVVDYLGDVPLSGVGGQVEFTIGSHYSRGGKTITVLPSTAKGGTVSRIVPKFVAGTQVAIPGHYLDYLVTEYGVVNLEGKGRRERAEAIISVAHPDFQAELRQAAKSRFYP